MSGREARRGSRRKAGGMPRYICRRLSAVSLASSWPLLALLSEHGPLPQREAARRLSLTPGACNLHCQRLAHERLIERCTVRRNDQGRPADLWDVNRSHNLCATLVFDVPYLQATLQDFAGHVICERREDLCAVTGHKRLLGLIRRFLDEAQAVAGRRDSVIRQAFGALPGLLAPANGTVQSAANFPLLNGLDLDEFVRARYGFRCFTGYLGLPFYYGEVGAVPPDASVLVVYLDLGIGAVCGRGERVLSLAPGDHPARPRHPGLGHMRIRRQGRTCHCGGRGCLEAYAGGWAMLKRLGIRGSRGLAELVARVEAGEPGPLAVVREAMECLGHALCLPLQVLNVERIRVTGPLAPVFRAGQAAFRRGLAGTFTEREIGRFDPQAAADHTIGMRTGAARMARRVFFHPEEFGTTVCSTPRSTGA